MYTIIHTCMCLSYYVGISWIFVYAQPVAYIDFRKVGEGRAPIHNEAQYQLALESYRNESPDGILVSMQKRLNVVQVCGHFANLFRKCTLYINGYIF